MKRLSRRTFLRGSIGTAVVGLPLLEAMLNTNGTALADGSALPCQLVVWFMGNGYRLEELEPAITGESYALSPELQPFANVDPYVSIVTGLQNWCAAQVTHHEGMTALNGYTMTELAGLFSKAGGPTIDQVVADYIAANAPVAPPVRSIQIGVSRRRSIMDSGTTMHSISHRGPNENLEPEFNPQVVFTTLFGEFQPKPDDSALRKSVLDAVREDAKKLQGRLGASDRQRLEAHLDGIRQLEDKIDATPPSCVIPSMPTETNPDVAGVPEPIASVNQVMSDLLVYAMTCDITRVASVLFIGGAAETNFDEIGQSSVHHNNTHDQFAQAAVHDGVVYAHSKLAYLLERMQATMDPTGLSLLDTGLVLSTSDCSVGYSHSVSRQPYILVGKLRDRFRRYHFQKTGFSGTPLGENLAATGNTSDVLYTVLKAFDPAAASIGDMTPRNLSGDWYGGSTQAQAASGSSTIIPEITGPAFGT